MESMVKVDEDSLVTKTCEIYNDKNIFDELFIYAMYRGQSVESMVKVDEDSLVTCSEDGIIRIVSIQPNKLLVCVCVCVCASERGRERERERGRERERERERESEREGESE